MNDELKYYFETNALYQLKNIDLSFQQEGFYSAFGLIELIAGINPSDFEKRRAIIFNVEQSPLKFDGSMLEQKLFESFDCLEDLDFKEQRTDDLLQIKNSLLNATDYESFIAECNFSERRFNFDHFKSLDSFFTSNFKLTTQSGMQMIKDSQLDGKPASLNLGGINYDLSTKKGIDFLLSNSAINEFLTIHALAAAAQNNFLETPSEEQIDLLIKTYNGRLNIYVKAFSLYSKDQVILGSTPGKNDQQDLYHLYYLSTGQYILSNDKIYKKYIPDQTIVFQ
jgi:hypothetical protein